jgi:hypothetical protein
MRLQVMHRCRCSNATVCGTLEAQVERLAAAGAMPYRDIPPAEREATNRAESEAMYS